MAKPTTTGSVFHGGVFDYATARDRNITARRRDLDPEVELPPNLPDQLSRYQGKLSSGVTHALPSDKVLLRVFEFPTIEHEEIEAMVENEMYDAVPFPMEHMEVRHQILSQGSEFSKVLACAVQRNLLDSLGDAYKNAGVKLNSVDVEVLAWVELMKHHGKAPGKGRHLVMFKDPAGTELVLLEDDIPISFRSLGRHDLEDGESYEEYIEEITEELGYSLTAFEGEWGSDPIQSLTVWHKGAVPEGIGHWGNICGLVARTESLDSIGRLSEGVAIRSSTAPDGPGGTLDLTPDDWKEAEENRRNLRNAVWTVIGILGLWALVMAGIWAASKWQHRRANQIVAEADLRVDEPIKEYGELSANVRFLEKFNDRKYSALDSLMALYGNLPSGGAGIKVRDINYGKGDAISLKGTADRPQLVTQWVAQLREKTDFIVESPKITRSRSARDGAQEFQFRLEFPEDTGGGG